MCVLYIHLNVDNYGRYQVLSECAAVLIFYLEISTLYASPVDEESSAVSCQNKHR